MVFSALEWWKVFIDMGEKPLSQSMDKKRSSNKRKYARPYDLRHNFATRTLMRWIDEKRDIMTLMPYLSTYMGHVSLEETMYYIHLLPERLKTSPGINWGILSEIYEREDIKYEDD